MANLAAKAITRGSLSAIFEENSPFKEEQPIVQCVQIKLLPSKGLDQPDRYRLIFSDIDNFIQSMLATSMNHIVTDGTLKRGHIVRLTGFQPNNVKDKKILIILGLDILSEYGEHEKIGEPVTLDPVATKGDGAAEQPGNIPGNGFYGNRPEQDQHQSRSLPSRPNQSSDSSHGNIYPIEALSPYAHKWTIKARVTRKTEIKTWHNKNGDGRLFSVNLLDESGEIRATVFSSSNDQFDNLWETLQEGNVYYISSPCSIKIANKRFSQVNNDYEMTFERDTRVERSDDNESVPQIRYNFTGIGDLESVEKDTTIDVIGILREVGELSQITSKTTSKPYDKRDITLGDSTLHEIRLTIWASIATNFDAPAESVIAFKGVKVSDFGGRSLSLLSSGSMSINPDIDEAHKLKGWYDAGGRNDGFSTHANLSSGMASNRNDAYQSIADIKDGNLGMGEKPDFFSLKASIVYIKPDNTEYPACKSTDCNKKVTEENPGKWRCERCDKSWDKPQWRYIMSLNVSDHTGQLWLNAFDDDSRVIMGITAEELQVIRDDDDPTKRLKVVFDDATCHTYVFRVMAKMDTYKDEQRVRYTIKSMNKLNYSAEAAKLAEVLKQYKMDDGDLFVR